MIVYDKNGKEINLEEVKSQVIDVSGDGTLRLNVVDRIVILTFQGYSLSSQNVGDLEVIDLPKQFWAKNPIYAALFTNSKKPSPIMAWISRKSVNLYSVSTDMSIVGTIVYEIA